MNYEKSLKYFEEYIVNVLSELEVLQDASLDYYASVLIQNTASKLTDDNIVLTTNRADVEYNYSLLLPDCYRIIDNIHKVLSNRDYIKNHKVYDPKVIELITKANEHFETFKYIIANETYDKIKENKSLKEKNELIDKIKESVNFRERVKYDTVENENNTEEVVVKKRLPNIY